MGKRKVTGELALFKEVAKERLNICEVSGVRVNMNDIRCYAHVLSKGAAPDLRLNKLNILIMHPDVHYQYDFGSTKDDRRFDWVHELKSFLKSRRGLKRYHK